MQHRRRNTIAGACILLICIGFISIALLWPYIPVTRFYKPLGRVELGTFYVGNEAVHPDSKWTVAAYPLVANPLPNCNLILNYLLVNGTLTKPLTTTSEINALELEFKKIDPKKFWGTLFLAEEVYKTVVQFDDMVNTTFCGKTMLGYNLYLLDVPGANINDWRNAMYLRMVQGFYEYYHALGLKIGFTAHRNCVLDEGVDTGIEARFGTPAFQFFKDYFDFVILYQYTAVFEDIQSLNDFFAAIDGQFQKQQKFWILTRIWDESLEYWQREAMAPEIVRCLDKNITILQYKSTAPDILSYDAIWNLTCKAIDLYRRQAYYVETRVMGRNVLTGQEGLTYGWIEPRDLATIVVVEGIVAFTSVVVVMVILRSKMNKSIDGDSTLH